MDESDYVVRHRTMLSELGNHRAKLVIDVARMYCVTSMLGVKEPHFKI